jgi:hypothetical protein
MQKTLAREWVVLVLLLALGAAAASAGQWFARLDAAFYDASLALWRRVPDERIVLVAIDEASIARIGRWPWSRGVHATLLDRISAGAPAVIGLDVILSEPDTTNPTADQKLAEVIARSGRVVLPAFIDVRGSGMLRETMPIDMLARAAQSIGYIDAELDRDGIMRRVFLEQGVGGRARPAFAAAVLGVADAKAVATLPGMRRPHEPRGADTIVRDYQFAIPFAGPPGQFARVSYAAVLSGEIAPERFADRIVLVGATATGLGDAYPTPVSGESVAMPGIEVTANTIDAILRGIDLRSATPITHAAVAAILVALMLAIYPFLTPRASILITLGATLAAVLASLALFRAGQLWWSPAVALLAFAFAYPLWSWRRLEAANRHLDFEMQRMTRERGLLHVDAHAQAAADAKPGWQDKFAAQLIAAEAAAEELRRSRRLFAQSLAGLPVAVVVCRADERVALMNPLAERVLGDTLVESATALSRSLTRHFRDAAPGQWAGELRRALVDGETVSREVSTIEGHPYVLSIAPCELVGGAGAIVALADVAELKRAEQERDEAMRFISHDLRAPQNSILAIAELAIEEDGDAAHRALFDRIAGHAQRTLDLIDSMLALARAERLAPAAFTAVDLVQVALQAFDEAWPIAKARHQRLTRELPEGPAGVRGNADHLRRALLNLLTNAVKYSPPGAPIRLSLTRRGEAWVYTVQDRGRGIAAEQLPRVFDRYYRAVADPLSDPGGFGLGLAFVKAVAQRHGGDVQAQSVAGEGSTFSIRLPARAGSSVPMGALAREPDEAR